MNEQLEQTNHRGWHCGHRVYRSSPHRRSGAKWDPGAGAGGKLSGIDEPEKRKNWVFHVLTKALKRCCQIAEIHVVHLATPNFLHFPQAKAALLAGKHVVCEKPLALTAVQSAELVKLAAEKKLVNAVNFNIRMYPMVQQARSLVQAGEIGDVFHHSGILFTGLVVVTHRLELAFRAGSGWHAACGW